MTQMRQVYAGLPNVRVAPLHFAPEDISGERLLAMMKVDTDSRKYLSLTEFGLRLKSMLRDASIHGGHHGHPPVDGDLQLSQLPEAAPGAGALVRAEPEGNDEPASEPARLVLEGRKRCQPRRFAFSARPTDHH
jgi:hypothetical protein